MEWTSQVAGGRDVGTAVYFNGTGRFAGMKGGSKFDWMKWSDDWLSNKDCSGDGKLDRGAPGSSGYPTISQGWLTNHVKGDYDSDGDGTQDAHYTWFVKIVWVGPGGSLWEQYTIIQEVYNDPTGGYHGLQFKAAAPGLGLSEHWTQQ